MVRFALRIVPLWVLALLVFAPLAAAQQQAPLVGIEPMRASIDQIEVASRRSPTVNELIDLSQSLGPLRDQIRDKLADLEPQFADVQARLKGLGTPVAGSAEDSTIAADRARLTQQRNEFDSALKQVQLLQTRAEQLTTALSDKRRAAYAETMFRRSPSVLDPYFWYEVILALPEEGARLLRFVQELDTNARTQAGLARITSAAVTLSGLCIFAIGFIRWWRRHAFIAKIGARYGTAIASLAVFLRRTLTAPIALFVVFELLDQFKLIPDAYERFEEGLIFGVAMAALARGAATSVLAPDDPARRQIMFGDISAKWHAHHLIWAGRLFGAFLALRALERTIGSAETVSTALRMIFALAIVVVLVHLLVRERDDEEHSPRRIPGVRLLAWAAVAVILGALLAGYSRFGAFAAGRVVFTLTLIATLYLLFIVTDAAINRTMAPDSTAGRKLARQIGIDPRRLGLFGKLTSGIVRALFVLVIIALGIGRWEVAAGDLLEAMRNFSFGIRIGDFTISFGAVFGAIGFFLVVVVLTRLLQRWLETEVMPHTAIEPSLQLSIVTILGYVGFIIAVVLALGEIGIDPQKIALVAGALSVGIGFGLQSIVSNFVSGLILLAERPIRVGDQIVVKGDEGFVRRISVRATEIETFEKASVIIPNSELITGVVKNWTHANTLGRLNIKVTTGYDVDAEQVIALLEQCVAEHQGVLKLPAPAVLLTELGSALTFEVFCIVPNLADRGGVKSDLHIAILRAAREAGIGFAPPQDLRLIGGMPQPVAGKA